MSKRKRRAKRQSWRDRWRKWAARDRQSARVGAVGAVADFRLEPLEQRILLTTIVGGERFEFIAPDPTDPDADLIDQPLIGVSVGGDAIIEVIAADIDDENLLVFGDAPGLIVRSDIGRDGIPVLGGLGGVDGIELIGPTPISDNAFLEGNIPVDNEDSELNNLQAIASRDPLGFGDTYGINVSTVQIPETGGRDIVQLVQLDNLDGLATVRAMLHQATLGEDVAATLSSPITDVEAVAVSPTGVAFAIGDVGGESSLFQINRVNGVVTPIGLLNGGGISDVRAMAIDSASRMFVLTQTSALAEVDPGTGLFLSSTGVTEGGAGVTENYTGMAFDSGDALFAVLQQLDAGDNTVTLLHEINPTTAAATTVGNVELISDVEVGEGEDPPAGHATTIDAITFAVNINGVEILVGLDSSEIDDNDVIAARLVSIATSDGNSRSLSQPGGVTSVNGLGGFTVPGTNRPLLFSIDDGTNELIRGSAVTLQVDSSSGDSEVDTVLAAEFQPRIGNATDGKLFFVAASGDDNVDELFHIDVEQPNRSAVQNTLTSTVGSFGEVGTDDDGEGGVDRKITSIAWDQTGPSTVDLIGFNSITAELFKIENAGGGAGPINTNLASFGPQVFRIEGGQSTVVNDITGIA
ncbi:MAG: hypothetical protein QGG89_10410, partial [Vicinamibacterales bacterium]|nr:hypothetical protein [Vicinamibacterales bacterium]